MRWRAALLAGAALAAAGCSAGAGSFSSDGTGKFTGQLPPGTYAVTAESSLIDDGKGTCSGWARGAG
jgi:hypothetical protein